MREQHCWRRRCGGGDTRLLSLSCHRHIGPSHSTYVRIDMRTDAVTGCRWMSSVGVCRGVAPHHHCIAAPSTPSPTERRSESCTTTHSTPPRPPSLFPILYHVTCCGSR